MAKKYYAVKNGRTCGILDSWDECEASIKGFSGAKFKSFTSHDEALAYLGNQTSIKKENDSSINQSETSEATAYVDGSYNKTNQTYGSGVVLLYEDKEKEISQSGSDEVMLEMWNVAGEVTAAMIAIEQAICLGCKKITIHYDYNGIEGWVRGCLLNGKRSKIWKAEKAGAKMYKQFVADASEKIIIDFIKVKAHSGDHYNDRADRLAKDACGIV